MKIKVVDIEKQEYRNDVINLLKSRQEEFIKSLDNSLCDTRQDLVTRWAKVIIIADSISKSNAEYINRLGYAGLLLGMKETFPDNDNKMICICQALKYLGYSDNNKEIPTSENSKYEKLVRDELYRVDDTYIVLS